ncbi:hypothetical protein NCS57_01484000 [Fusarium keratoplasticum]|uniref:Uncharacterized protein n=1 Tax=Fusarium keratoplasticum TaxID=1328300 RepID=A0ACC0QBF7_9HYPO|nr:hypothetical protein NCS57_01484000 [Fusarium keratoplasticum]KAI8648718.1 hypothetical protein NCS57_01484000 [Fusarium keratoplasticum]
MWGYETLKNKLRNLKGFWRVFRDAADLSGTEYDEDTGRLYMSRSNAKKVRDRNPHHGNKVISDGLLIGPYISFDSWGEIFSDDPPAGRLITAATDERAWGGHAGSAAEAQDSDALMADDDEEEEEEEEDEIKVDIEEEAGNRLNSLPHSQPQSQLPNSLQLPDSLLEGGDSQPIPASPRTSHTPAIRLTPSSTRLRERQRTAISEYHTQTSSSSRKKSKGQGTITAEELKELLHEDSARRLSVTLRAAGSEDLERAVSNCLEVIGEAYGIPYAVRAIAMFKEVRNAVIWNALGSVEVKKAWVESQIGPAE